MKHGSSRTALCAKAELANNINGGEDNITEVNEHPFIP